MIEDLDGAEDVLYPLRELPSKKRISKTVVHKNTKGETRTVHLTVEGPVSVAGCTTKESLYEDNANRSFLIYIRESKEQDERVMQYQRCLSAGKVDTTEQKKIVQQFEDFMKFFNYKDKKGNSRNKITDLFSGGKKDEDFIINQLNKYKAEYEKAQEKENEAKKNGLTSMVNNFSNLQEGTYKLDSSSSSWVRQ